MPPSRSILSLGLSNATLSSLTSAGYETTEDLATATVDGLAQEIKISLDDAKRILSLSRPSATPNPTLNLTQTAAALAKPKEKLSTGCPGLDRILSGGLQRGHILEISGPPGSPKELIAINVLTAFARCGDEVLVVDCQNMIRPATLLESFKRMSNCPSDIQNLVHYRSLPSLPEFMLFIQQLPRILASIPKTSLLILSSMPFPFQSANLSPANKAPLLDRVKQALTKETAGRSLTIVLTSQMAIKMVNSDGSPGSFDTGARGIMVPQLGASYLPAGKTYRVVLSPDGRTSGVVKLLSSPVYQSTNGPSITEPYALECS